VRQPRDGLDSGPGDPVYHTSLSVFAPADAGQVF
jgi:hypothetical protein